MNQTPRRHTSTQHYAPYPPSKRDSPPNPPLVQQSHTNNHCLLRDLSLGFSGPLPAAHGHPKSTLGQGVDSGGFIQSNERSESLELRVLGSPPSRASSPQVHTWPGCGLRGGYPVTMNKINNMTAFDFRVVRRLVSPRI